MADRRTSSVSIFLLASLCVPAALVGCASRKPVSSTAPVFRLQALKSGSVLFAPTIPASRVASATVILDLDRDSSPSDSRGSCSWQEGPFQLEAAKNIADAPKIVLPPPEQWLDALEAHSPTAQGDAMDLFFSFLADLDQAESAGCFSSKNHPIRQYVLQSIPMRPSESLFNSYGYRLERSGLDLKPGLRLKIDRAYFRPVGPGEQEHQLKDYLGLSTVSFEVERSGDQIRFQQIGGIQFSNESLRNYADEGVKDLELGNLEARAHYRLLFYTHVVPTQHDVSSVVMGSKSSAELDALQQVARTGSAVECKKWVESGESTCLDFTGFVTLSPQIRVELNGRTHFLDWATNVKEVVPSKAMRFLKIQREFMGSYYELLFDPSNPDVRSLTLVGGDRLTWLKASKVITR